MPSACILACVIAFQLRYKSDTIKVGIFQKFSHEKIHEKGYILGIMNSILKIKDLELCKMMMEKVYEQINKIFKLQTNEFSEIFKEDKILGSLQRLSDYYVANFLQEA